MSTMELFLLELGQIVGYETLIIQRMFYSIFKFMCRQASWTICFQLEWLVNWTILPNSGAPSPTGRWCFYMVVLSFPVHSGERDLKKWLQSWQGPTMNVFTYKLSFSSQLDWAERHATRMICWQFLFSLNSSFGDARSTRQNFGVTLARNATLRESFPSRLQMSGGPSNCFMSSATPVTVREASERAPSTPLGTARSSTNASIRKLPVKPVIARIGLPNNQTRASTQDVQAPKGSISEDRQACTTG